MIRTAVFSWKAHKPLTVWECIMWAGSVQWAAHWFDEVVLVADKPGQKVLNDLLRLPFTRTIDLPDIDNSLERVYGLPKLWAQHILATERKPYVHLDFDAFLRARLPERMLQAPFIAEASQEPKPFVSQLNSALVIPRLKSCKLCLTGGMQGGCDVDGIEEWTARSINVATCPENRKIITENFNGHQWSVLIEEAASGEKFGDVVQLLLPTASAEERMEAGWIHLAGPKDDSALILQAAWWVQRDWPDLYDLTLQRHDQYWETGPRAVSQY